MHHQISASIQVVYAAIHASLLTRDGSILIPQQIVLIIRKTLHIGDIEENLVTIIFDMRQAVRHNP